MSMRHRGTATRALACCLIWLTFTPFLPAQAPGDDGEHARVSHHDLVIYGGTSSGVIAAIQGARDGLDVLLLAPEGRLGGLTTSGLGATDTGDRRAIGGLALDFYRRLLVHYRQDGAWRHEEREGSAAWRPFNGALFRFEPRVAARVLEEMLDPHRSRVTVRLRDAELAPRAVLRSGPRILGLRTLDGRIARGRVFIDATYEGDLLAAAGVSWTLGREGNARYGESLNGVQTRRAVHHQFDRPVPAHRIPFVPRSGVLPGIAARRPGPDGRGDALIQAYNFRLCLTDVPENRRPFERPEGHDDRHYELLLRWYDAGATMLPWHSIGMPNRKTDTNNNGPFSTDWIGGSHRWPTATWRERRAIARRQKRYQQGLLWTLCHHPRVPAQVRREARRWGLARDEFTATENWPPQVYVREGRRLVGETVVTEHHCLHRVTAPDPVGMGSYTMDSHNVQRWVDEAGHVHNEGDVQVLVAGAYGIPWRALVPRREQASNLVVPVAVSASHIAFGSLRMEPVFMILGQSAAVGARMALERGVPVQDVPYAALRADLLALGQVLSLPPPPLPEGALPLEDAEGIVMDDTQATLEGAWTTSRSTPPFLGRGYRHDGAAGSGARAVFRLRVPTPGRHAVRLAWSPHPNRAPAMPVVVRQGDTTLLVTKLDQRAPAPSGGPWHELGEFDLVAGPLEVVIRNEGCKGYVIIDAVQLLPR